MYTNLVTLKQFAEAQRISLDTLYSWIRIGEVTESELRNGTTYSTVSNRGVYFVEIAGKNYFVDLNRTNMNKELYKKYVK